MAILIPFMIFSDTWAIVGLTTLLSTIAVFEIFACIGQKKRWLLIALSVLVSIAIQVLTRVMEPEAYLSTALLIYLAYIVLMMMAAVFSISIPLIVLFLIFRKRIMEGVARGGTKG